MRAHLLEMLPIADAPRRLRVQAVNAKDFGGDLRWGPLTLRYSHVSEFQSMFSLVFRTRTPR
jgi:hypothetical protein